MKRVLIRVSGKVQGVFFRATAKQEADRLGLCGRVRNEPNGDVSVEAEGDEAALGLFVEWCRKGPPRAKVLTFVMNEAEPVGYVGFRIDRS